MKCYNFFNCKKQDTCPAGETGYKCWEVPNTFCGTYSKEIQQIAHIINLPKLCDQCNYRLWTKVNDYGTVT